MKRRFPPSRSISAMATAASATVRPSLQSLLYRSIPSLRHSLTPSSRLASLDVTPSHVSIALSNRDRDTAFPFGLLARTSKPSADALILSSALRLAESRDPGQPLNVHALVVGLSPTDGEADNVVNYVHHLLEEDDLFPGLRGVLFYSETHAVRHAVDAQRDYKEAVKSLPVKLESRKLPRFAAAMNPKVGPEEVQYTFESRATISASEILQAVLDDLKREQS